MAPATTTAAATGPNSVERLQAAHVSAQSAAVQKHRQQVGTRTGNVCVHVCACVCVRVRVWCFFLSCVTMQCPQVEEIGLLPSTQWALSQQGARPTPLTKHLAH